MFRFLLTPRWIALHLVMAAALLGCLALGWWQLGVYDNSRDRQDIRDQAPVAVGELSAPGQALGDARDRQVVAQGHYLTDRQRLVPGRIHDGVLGSYVVTPLRVSDELVVPVLRGWVDNPDDPAAAAPTDEVTVTGYLLPPETADDATMRSGQLLRAGELDYIAPDRIRQQTGVPTTAMPRGYLLLQDEQPASSAAPSVLDVGAVAPIRDVSPWQNLSYWAQWWVFAVAAIVFWVSAVRSGVRSRRREVTAPAPTRVPS